MPCIDCHYPAFWAGLRHTNGKVPGKAGLAGAPDCNSMRWWAEAAYFARCLWLVEAAIGKGFLGKAKGYLTPIHQVDDQAMTCPAWRQGKGTLGEQG